MLKIVLISAAVIYGFIYLIMAVRTKKPFKTIFMFALFGILALLAVNFTSKYSGIHLPVNEYTISATAVFGLPGTVFLLLLRMIFI